VFDHHVHYETPTVAKPDQLRVLTLLAEYMELSWNIRDRVKLEQGLFNYALVFLAALVPITVQLIDHKAFVALFVVPWVFCPLAILILRQDLMITCVARYAYLTLLPQLRAVSGRSDSFRLEDRLSALRNSLGYVPIAVSRYAIFFIPSIASVLGVAILKRSSRFFWLPVDTYLTVLDSGLILFTVLLVLARSARSYMAITK
jgi:hypothetical protein